MALLLHPHHTHEGPFMKAIIHTAYGDPRHVLRVDTIEPPPLKADSVRIRNRAYSLNAGDWHVVRGNPFPLRFAFGLFTPKHRVPGSDFAGVVEDVGANVTDFRIGDAVFGDVSLTGLGAFAEYVHAPASVITHKPETISFEEAAASPGAVLAALQGLRDAAGVRPGQHVLINGASGGVGSFAVQLAKHMGARVTGVCSTRNLDLVTSFGADHVIDYTRTDFAAQTGIYDVIFDAAAFRPYTEVLQSLTPTGTYVFVGGGNGTLFRAMTVGSLATRKNGRKIKIFMARANSEDLRRIAERLSTGVVRPSIERVYTFEETADALAILERGRTRGKLVVTL